MDKKQNIKIEFNLIIKKLEGVLTEKEKEEFDRWYAVASPEDLERFRDIEDFHLRNNRMPFAGKTVQQKDQSISPKGRQKPYWWLGVAASVAILVSLGIYFYDHLIPGSMPEATIEVGSSKAVLTLEDGTEVALKKGEEYTSGNIYSNGAQIVYDTKNTAGHAMTYNQLTVPRGGEYLLLLADNTKVWLNSDTRIKYPQRFTVGAPRTVELIYGEAYFEVSPAAKHGGSSFTVNTRNQEIEVLGTQFNISAYQGEDNITSTLVEGKVAVTNGNTRKELQPGQQAIVADGAEIQVKEVNIYPYTAWKKGLFVFRSTPLREVMQDLARWYDIKVEFMTKEREEARFSGVVNRKQDIEEVLAMISSNIRFRIEGKTVIIE